MTELEGHFYWELISDYGFVILTVIGVIGVLYYIYRERRYQREREKHE